MSNNKTGDLLSFGDYSPEHGADGTARIDVEAVHTNSYNVGAPQPPGSGFATSSSLGSPDDEPASAKSNHNFWTLEYYQKYFDVQTSEVLERILSSVVPTKVSQNYFDERIRGKPDLYGPFWIATTLVFAIGISSNIANYLQSYGNPAVHWRYDFHKLSLAATTIFSYVSLLPMALWAAIKFTTVDNPDPSGDDQQLQESQVPSMISLYCLYGYSLSIYIPVCILWTIQVSWLQWLLVLTAASVSGIVLVFWLLPALKNSRFCPVLIAAIFGVHLLLAASFMLYFFHDSSVPTIVTTTTSTTLKPSAAALVSNATRG